MVTLAEPPIPGVDFHEVHEQAQVVVDVARLTGRVAQPPTFVHRKKLQDLRPLGHEGLE